MSAINALAVPTNEKHEKPVSSKKSSSVKSLIASLISQALPIMLAAGLSFGIYNYKEEAISAYSEFATNFQQQGAAAPQVKLGNELQVFQEELEYLLQQNKLLQLQVQGLLDQKKDSKVGITEDQFYMNQFMQYFRIAPLDAIEVDEAVQPHFEKYNILEDPYYLANKVECDALDGEYSDFLQRSSVDDQRFAVKWSEDRQDYALYARAAIATKTILGYFTGTLRVRAKDINDAWRFKGEIYDEEGDMLDLVIDSRFKGNWFHFLRLGSSGNTEAILVPDLKNNMWNILFKTKRAVEAGEELFLNAGDLE